MSTRDALVYAMHVPADSDAVGWLHSPRSPGLYFLGMHWRRRPASAFVGGVGGEAEHIAAEIAARRAGNYFAIAGVLSQMGS